VGDFSKSNQLLANAFYEQVEDAYLDLLDTAKLHGFKTDDIDSITFLNRIGYVERIDVLCRREDEFNFLSDEDNQVLNNEPHVFLELESLSMLERFIALGVHLYLSMLHGKYSEVEMIYLHRILLMRFGWYYAGGWEEKKEIKSNDQFNFSELGKAGADKKHKPMRDLRTKAIELYKKGNWKSPNHAAYELKDQIIAEGKILGASLSVQNAQRTIGDWIRRYG
jgi:hypothetical protein